METPSPQMLIGILFNFVMLVVDLLVLPFGYLFNLLLGNIEDSTLQITLTKVYTSLSIFFGVIRSLSTTFVGRITRSEMYETTIYFEGGEKVEIDSNKSKDIYKTGDPQFIMAHTNDKNSADNSISRSYNESIAAFISDVIVESEFIKCMEGSYIGPFDEGDSKFLIDLARKKKVLYVEDDIDDMLVRDIGIRIYNYNFLSSSENIQDIVNNQLKNQLIQNIITFNNENEEEISFSFYETKEYIEIYLKLDIRLYYFPEIINGKKYLPKFSSNGSAGSVVINTTNNIAEVYYSSERSPSFIFALDGNSTEMVRSRNNYRSGTAITEDPTISTAYITFPTSYEDSTNSEDKLSSILLEEVSEGFLIVSTLALLDDSQSETFIEILNKIASTSGTRKLNRMKLSKSIPDYSELITFLELNGYTKEFKNLEIEVFEEIIGDQAIPADISQNEGTLEPISVFSGEIVPLKENYKNILFDLIKPEDNNIKFMKDIDNRIKFSIRVEQYSESNTGFDRIKVIDAEYYLVVLKELQNSIKLDNYESLSNLQLEKYNDRTLDYGTEPGISLAGIEFSPLFEVNYKSENSIMTFQVIEGKIGEDMFLNGIIPQINYSYIINNNASTENYIKVSITTEIVGLRIAESSTEIIQV